MADELELRLVRIETLLPRIEGEAGEIAKKLPGIEERLLSIENYWKVLLATAAVLTALGITLSIFVSAVNKKVEGLATISASMDDLRTKLEDLEKRREVLTESIARDAQPQVVKAIQSALPIPSGAVMLWWPAKPDEPNPTGWQDCLRDGKSANGWMPQFDFAAQSLGHQTQFHATPANQVQGNQVNVSVMRMRCLMRN